MENYKYLHILQQYFIFDLSFIIIKYIPTTVYMCVTKKDFTYSTYKEYINIFSTLNKCIDHCVYYSLTYESTDEFVKFYNYLNESEFNVSKGVELYSTILNTLIQDYSRYDAKDSVLMITNKLENIQIGCNTLDFVCCEDYYHIKLGLNSDSDSQSDSQSDFGIYRNESKYADFSNVKILYNLRLVLYEFNL